MNYEHHGERAAFIAARGNFGSSRGFHGERDSRGCGRTGGRGPHKCTLIVAALIILWITVGIYMAHHLHLPTTFLCMRILQPHMDHLLARAHL